MAYSVVYKKSVHRDLKSLSRAEAKRIMDLIEHELIKRPESNPVPKGQFSRLRKFRAGNYRVIYALIASEILILRIGDRKNVYKREI
ncbi:MAG: type II toxin-antitoxin system RelE/ParE family toxin [Candidatus Lindowbacteria bacterium]|nr:type II toxin-antitoxin system RelE/ParE family toxin [Candidatus Lindowbacteria bacterium]